MHLALLPLGLISILPFALAAPYKQGFKAGKLEIDSSIVIRATADNSSSQYVKTGWYPGWAPDFPPSKIPWDRYTSMTFAFALTTADPKNISLDDTSKEVLPDFVSSAKANNVKALLSIGGWTGSQYFSPAVATEDSRKTFVQTILALVQEYKLDGIDFDWEYPNQPGIGCNQISPDDAENFLSFLKEFRKDPVGNGLILTAAVAAMPFVGSDNSTMSDVSGFAEVLDHIAIMVYDFFGSWSETVGPNAPLDNTCAPANVNTTGSALDAVTRWTNAGFPSEKIVLGVPAYGHNFSVTPDAALKGSSLQLYPPQLTSKPDPNAETDICGTAEGRLDTLHFSDLITQGFLNADGTPNTGNPDIHHIFDACSQTPFVYNSDTQSMVSYDDPTSFKAKGAFIKEHKLAGFAVWEVTGDSDNILVDAITQAMGSESAPSCPTTS